MGGTPSSPGLGGTPGEYPPLASGMGTLHLDLGWGTSLNWDGVPLCLDLGQGTPQLDLGWGTPLPGPVTGYPLPHLDLGWGTVSPISWMGYPAASVDKQTPVKTVPCLVLRTRAVTNVHKWTYIPHMSLMNCIPRGHRSFVSDVFAPSSSGSKSLCAASKRSRRSFAVSLYNFFNSLPAYMRAAFR